MDIGCTSESGKKQADMEQKKQCSKKMVYFHNGRSDAARVSSFQYLSESDVGLLLAIEMGRDFNASVRRVEQLCRHASRPLRMEGAATQFDIDDRYACPDAGHLFIFGIRVDEYEIPD
jgi:hypothetical protein